MFIVKHLNLFSSSVSLLLCHSFANRSFSLRIKITLYIFTYISILMFKMWVCSTWVCLGIGLTHDTVRFYYVNQCHHNKIGIFFFYTDSSPNTRPTTYLVVWEILCQSKVDDIVNRFNRLIIDVIFFKFEICKDCFDL